MVQEIKGKDWHKEVGTIKTNPDIDAKREKFYEKRSDFKSGEAFDSIVGDLVGKGYKTLADLKESKDHEIKKGDTLFPILKEYFAASFPDMAPDQVEKEAYLSLAFVMKNNQGRNVDSLMPKGHANIEKGYLTVTTEDGTKTIDNAALRPEASAPVEVPEPVQTPPVTEPVPATPPVDTTDVPTDEPHLTIEPKEPESVKEPEPVQTPPVTEPVPATPPVDTTDVPKDETHLRIEESTEGTKLTKDQIDAGYSGKGTYTNEEHSLLVGTFEKGILIEGSITFEDGQSQIGTFDPKTGNLINGTYITADGIQEIGTFARDGDGHLIDGKVVIDGKTTQYKDGKPVEDTTTPPSEYEDWSKLSPEEREKVNGQHKVTFGNDDKAEGVFKNGNLIDGTETYKGAVFTWENGKLVTIADSDGGFRHGSFVLAGDNRYYLVDGIYTNKDGIRYEGKWDNQGSHFTGTKTTKDGKVSKYENGVETKNETNSSSTDIKEYTEEEIIGGKFTGPGRYTDKDNNKISGDFEGGMLSHGKIVRANGDVEEGNFDISTGHLLDGTWTSADKTKVEYGKFENSDDNKLIDGTRTVNGVVEYVFPEKLLTDIESVVKTKNLKPKSAGNLTPYFPSGNGIGFKDGYLELWSTTVWTVENPEKAKQLADKLNERYPLSKIKPLAEPVEEGKSSGATNGPIVAPDKITE